MLEEVSGSGLFLFLVQRLSDFGSVDGGYQFSTVTGKNLLIPDPIPNGQIHIRFVKIQEHARIRMAFINPMEFTLIILLFQQIPTILLMALPLLLQL